MYTALNFASMKHPLLFLILTTATGFNSEGQSNRFEPSFSVVVDTSIGKQLLNQCSRATPANVQSFWTPTPADITEMENNFTNIYFLKASECCWKGAKVDSLHNFSFQYLGVIIKGQKYIYINAFPSGSESWYKDHEIDLSKNALIICDGGSSYWGVLYDRRKRRFFSLSFNGDA